MSQTTEPAAPAASLEASEGPDTAHVYGRSYFQGGRSTSNYDDYITQALGPSRVLAEMLVRNFRPSSALDVGCAVGHTVKFLRENGVAADGIDISEWAVREAAVDYVTRLDFSREKVSSRYDLVFSYDVVEHIPMERLKFSIENLWRATDKHLLIVPAIYPEGTTEDENEPTHLIFHDYQWWVDFCVSECGCIFDEEATNLLIAEEHSKVFDYASRIIAFKKR